MKTILRAAITVLTSVAIAAASGTLTGKFVIPTIGAIQNGTLTLTLSQQANVSGSYAVVPAQATCYTSTDGSVVGVGNPTAIPQASFSSAAGSLPQGNYFIEITYSGPSGTETLASPEVAVTANSTGQITVTAPNPYPSTATGWNVYIGTASGSETKQASNLSFGGNYIQSSALAAGSASPPSTNSTACTLAFNDTMIPTGTYYTASLYDVGQNLLPGYPQNWYLAGSTIDVSQIQPLVTPPSIRYPYPLLLNPPSTAAQSIGSSIQLNGHGVNGSSNVGPAMVSGFYSGALPAPTATIGTWTPNVAITVRRLSLYAETAGTGSTNGLGVAVTDGVSTCSFSGLLPANAVSGSSTPTGSCQFSAGVQLTLEVISSDYATRPSNVVWNLEETAQ